MGSLFSDENKSVTKGNPYIKWGKVGDRVNGYLVRKSTRLNDLKEDDGQGDVYQRVYTLLVKEGQEFTAHTKEGEVVVKEGELLDVYGKMLSRDLIEDKRMQIILGAEEVPLGRMIGFMFTGTKPPVKKGWSATQLVETFSDKNDERKDLLEKNTWDAMGAPEAPAVKKAKLSKEDSEEVPY